MSPSDFPPQDAAIIESSITATDTVSILRIVNLEFLAAILDLALIMRLVYLSQLPT